MERVKDYFPECTTIVEKIAGRELTPEEKVTLLAFLGTVQQQTINVCHEVARRALGVTA